MSRENGTKKYIEGYQGELIDVTDLREETKCSSATDHVWSKRCDFLHGTGVHYICERCGHSSTYLRLRVSEEQALESIQRPYFTIGDQGWSGKFQAEGTVELDISELMAISLIGSPGRLNWGRIPPEGFPPTFNCEHVLFWSEEWQQLWNGWVRLGQIWVDNPVFLPSCIKDLSHFAVFNTPRRGDDYQESTTE